MKMTPLQDGSTVLCGTLYGSYDYPFEGKGAWVGHAILAIGGRPPVKATFVDRNDSITRQADGGISGTETITLLFPESGAFEVCAKFTGTPASTPGLYALHEAGLIANGTGVYAGVSGEVEVQGPFLFPDPTVTAGAPPWIAEMHGVLQGLS
jgi:hypothetical protein